MLTRKKADQELGEDCFGFVEDWVDNYVTGDRWTPLTADSSSASTLVLVKKTTGAAKGILSITQDATDNDEIYFGTTVSMNLIAQNKPILLETSHQYAELNTNANNVMFGLLSTYAANTLIDDGGGPVASATMAVIYKLDGGTVWRCRSQIGAAVGQTDTVSVNTAGGTAFETLGIEIRPYSATNAYVYYTSNGSPLMQSAGGRLLPIVHDLVYTNAVASGPFFGVKTGSGTAEVNLNDYISCFQKR